MGRHAGGAILLVGDCAKIYGSMIRSGYNRAYTYLRNKYGVANAGTEDECLRSHLITDAADKNIFLLMKQEDYGVSAKIELSKLMDSVMPYDTNQE